MAFEFNEHEKQTHITSDTRRTQQFGENPGNLTLVKAAGLGRQVSEIQFLMYLPYLPKTLFQAIDRYTSVVTDADEP